MSAISRRMHLVLLAAWTILWFAVVQPHGGFSWHYLRTGGELLYADSGRADGGLNLYAHHPPSAVVDRARNLLQRGSCSACGSNRTLPQPGARTWACEP